MMGDFGMPRGGGGNMMRGGFDMGGGGGRMPHQGGFRPPGGRGRGDFNHGGDFNRGRGDFNRGGGDFNRGGGDFNRGRGNRGGRGGQHRNIEDRGPGPAKKEAPATPKVSQNVI